MKKSEVENYLKTTEEGKELWADLSKGLRSNRDEIKEEKRRLKSEFDLLSEKYHGLESSWLAEKEERKHNALTNGINNALKGIGIDPEGFDDVKAILNNSGEFSLDDETGVISYGDTPINEFMNEFKNTNTAKRYTPVRNSGAGAFGSRYSGGGSSAPDMSEMSSTEILQNLHKFNR